MYSFSKISISFLFIVSVFISCQKSYNETEIEIIDKLEEITLLDKKKINSIDTLELENYIKIAEFNLLKLEEKELDSVSVELIYFEYREYLNYIHKISFILHESKSLQKILILNANQLNNIKLDYMNAKERRYDLDEHLKNEQDFVLETSKKIRNTIIISEEINEKFDSLNKQIELIIYEN